MLFAFPLYILVYSARASIHKGRESMRLLSLVEEGAGQMDVLQANAFLLGDVRRVEGRPYTLQRWRRRIFFCEEIYIRAGMSDVAQLPEVTHRSEGIVPSERGTDGRETLHSPLTGWTPLIVGNQKKISLLVFYVTAWYAVVHRDKAVL